MKHEYTNSFDIKKYFFINLLFVILHQIKNNYMTKKVGRPKKNPSEKKVQVIYYIPKCNVKEFKASVTPFKKQYEKII
jgi:hypothetical protein